VLIGKKCYLWQLSVAALMVSKLHIRSSRCTQQLFVAIGKLPTTFGETTSKPNEIMLSRSLFVLACAFLSLACATAIDKQEDPFKRVDGLAPLLGSHHDDKIEDYYIVLFHPNHTHNDHYAHVGRNLSDAMHFVQLKSGYGAYVPDLSLLTQIRSDTGVLAVEVDREITIPDFLGTPTNETVPKYVDHEPDLAKQGTKTFETRKNYLAPWSLQTISAGKKLSSPRVEYEQTIANTTK
jgi:hypothetical protein